LGGYGWAGICTSAHADRRVHHHRRSGSTHNTRHRLSRGYRGCTGLGLDHCQAILGTERLSALFWPML
jgi:hypothetical protein